MFMLSGNKSRDHVIIKCDLKELDKDKDRTVSKNFLDPYSTTLSPVLLFLCPIESRYCYFCSLTLLLLCRPWLYCDPLESYPFVSSKNCSFMWCKRTVPPQRGFFQVIDLYFLLFLWSSYITFGIRALDPRVSIIQTNHLGIFTIIFFPRGFKSWSLSHDDLISW